MAFSGGGQDFLIKADLMFRALCVLPTYSLGQGQRI